jgi:tRNA-guanine family transglycosylase
MLGYRLATCHNLTFTLDFMSKIRSSIRAGTFSRTMQELRATRAGTQSAESGLEGRVKSE